MSVRKSELARIPSVLKAECTHSELFRRGRFGIFDSVRHVFGEGGNHRGSHCYCSRGSRG